MYPDTQYYYEDDKKAYCPQKGDGLLENCLKAEGVTEKDVDSDGFKACTKNFTKREKECKDGNDWSEYILKRHMNKSRPTKCDQHNTVHVLNLDESNFRKPYNKCDRPFLVQRIANSNLILLVTKSDCDKHMYNDSFSNIPTPFKEYEVSLFCTKLQKPLYRRYPKPCYTQHRNVSRWRRLIILL
jgi:hypothetical protein